MNDRQKTIFLDFLDLHDDVIEEFKESQDKQYWQGKKDGLRLAMVVVRDLLELDGVETARLLRNSSPAARSTRLEKLEAMVCNARFYIGEALWMARDDVPLHPLSRINWRQWIDWYDRMEEQGIVPEAKGAID